MVYSRRPKNNSEVELLCKKKNISQNNNHNLPQETFCKQFFLPSRYYEVLKGCSNPFLHSLYAKSINNCRQIIYIQICSTMGYLTLYHVEIVLASIHLRIHRNIQFVHTTVVGLKSNEVFYTVSYLSFKEPRRGFCITISTSHSHPAVKKVKTLLSSK